tara:strand:+ start:568 stop:1191 length:624 start_codon:yes stop_codon:yes gene_type:complete
MTDYEKMLSQFGAHWQQTPEGMEDLMNKIGHHESAGTMDPTIHQYGGGPGRGIFQYETGADQGGMTARNRLATWYGEQGLDIPDWLNQENMDVEGFDASMLSPEQQKMLFLADKRYHPTASLRPDDISDVGDWWAKNHWAGGEEGSDIYNQRVSSFNRDLEHNNTVNNVVTEQGADAFNQPEDTASAFGSKFGTGRGKIANFFKGFL